MYVLCTCALCLFVCNLNGGTGRFARGKLVYWSLNRVNEERSQPEGREKERTKERRQHRIGGGERKGDELEERTTKRKEGRMRRDKRKREGEIREGGKRREGKMRKKKIMRGEKGKGAEMIKGDKKGEKRWGDRTTGRKRYEIDRGKKRNRQRREEDEKERRGEVKGDDLREK